MDYDFCQLTFSLPTLDFHVILVNMLRRTRLLKLGWLPVFLAVCLAFGGLFVCFRLCLETAAAAGATYHACCPDQNGNANAVKSSRDVLLCCQDSRIHNKTVLLFKEAQAASPLIYAAIPHLFLKTAFSGPLVFPLPVTNPNLPGFSPYLSKTVLLI